MIATKQAAFCGPGIPAWMLSGGFVTQAEINRHGSYAAARKAKDMEIRNGRAS